MSKNIITTKPVHLLLIFFISITSSCQDKYIYQEYLPSILGTKEVKIKNKVLYDSWAIGEWYICETYQLDKATLDSFFKGKKNNSLYHSDSI